jgi:hypothetical protein
MTCLENMKLLLEQIVRVRQILIHTMDSAQNNKSECNLPHVYEHISNDVSNTLGSIELEEVVVVPTVEKRSTKDPALY